MNNKKPLLLVLLATLILGGLFTIRMMNGDSEEEQELKAKLAGENQAKSSSRDQAPSARSQSPEKPPETKETKEQKLLLTKALKSLSKTLPDWMNQKGMRFEDRREVLGHTVLRSRARHQWEDGRQMEIEVSDMGVGADESITSALGFNMDMEEASDESGVTQVDSYDDGDVLMNYEYDYADQAGSLQVLYGKRYMIEIQVQGLPEDSFQDILDKEVDFDKLYKTPPLEE